MVGGNSLINTRTHNKGSKFFGLFIQRHLVYALTESNIVKHLALDRYWKELSTNRHRGIIKFHHFVDLVVIHDKAGLTISCWYQEGWTRIR